MARWYAPPMSGPQVAKVLKPSSFLFEVLKPGKKKFWNLINKNNRDNGGAHPKCTVHL